MHTVETIYTPHPMDPNQAGWRRRREFRFRWMAHVYSWFCSGAIARGALGHISSRVLP